MSKKSLKRHFCQTLVLPILLALLAVGLAAFYSARHEIEEVYDAELARNARMMLSLMRHEVEEGEPNMQMLQERFGRVGHNYEKHIAIRMWKEEQLFYQSESAQDFGPQHVIAGFSNKEIGNEDWRFFVLPDSESGLTVEAAENANVRLDIIHKILFSMFAPVLLLVLIIPPLFWIGLRYGLKPLLRLSQEVGARSPDDLTTISEERTPIEILPLTQAINRLLNKLKIALDKERHFTNLAAHELRTPLAVIKTLTQSAQRARNDTERQQLLTDLNAATDRATNMMSQLLTLARLDHDNIDLAPISLGAIAREIIKDLGPLAHDKHILLSIREDKTVMINSNREMLLLAVRNLVDNAIKYTPPDGSITITVKESPESASIIVDDSGPGVPEEKLPWITERFYRVPGNREIGSGLGLAIVTKITHVLAAKLTLQNKQQTGLEVTLSFQPSTARNDRA